MAEYQSTNDFGNPLGGDEWLFDQNAPSMFQTSGSLDGAFDLGGGIVPTDGSMLGPYSITPGEYFHANAVSPSSPSFAPPPMMQPPEPGRLFCTRDGCNNTEGFSRPSDLKRHEQKHDKRHKCTECPLRFGSKADNQRHMREVHSIDTENGKLIMHFCPVTTCKRHSRGFPRLWNMQQHHSKMHGGPMPSPQSSPTVCSMDTPRFSSSGESAPNTPPSSVDEPNTPWSSQASASNPPGSAARTLIIQRLKQIESLRHANDNEAAELQAALRQLDREAK